MGFLQLLLIAVGLAMDAFAVSVCKGLNMRKTDYKYACLLGLFFGGFQAIMPTIGWILGRQFEQYITDYDHWIAFLLLAFIGGKMIAESFKKDDEYAGSSAPVSYNFKELFMLAVATSIDALAVGITFAFLGVHIAGAASLIGIVTFALSVFGVAVGSKFGAKYKSKAERMGGIVLVGIGLKILLEHLGILG